MAELKIGSHICIQRTINVKGIEFDKTDDGKKELYVNKLGQPLKKIQLQKSEYKWVNESTEAEETGKSYKSLNGKPVNTFSKTKSVASYDTCDISDTKFFIENEKTYQLISGTLKAELSNMPGKAIVFKYVNSGYKVHKAVVHLENIEGQDVILMRCFRGDLRKVDLTESEVDEIDADEGVGSLDLDALEV